LEGLDTCIRKICPGLCGSSAEYVYIYEMRNAYPAYGAEVHIASRSLKPFTVEGRILEQSFIWPVNPKYIGRPLV